MVFVTDSRRTPPDKSTATTLFSQTIINNLVSLWSFTTVAFELMLKIAFVAGNMV
jgi:hypothetical protein